VAISIALQLLLATPLELIDVVLRNKKSTPHELVHNPLVLGLLNIAALGTAITIGLVANPLFAAPRFSTWKYSCPGLDRTVAGGFLGRHTALRGG
jgi:hypothetical protein